jgi:tripartite-type tricarboxylate transporter receptor subunit TctC
LTLEAAFPAGITMRSLGAALAVVSLLCWTSREGAAQSYPQRPVRLVVPAPAGGPTDVSGRLIADGFTQAKMKSFGLVPKSGPPEEFAAWAAREGHRWIRVVKESGAKAH